MNREKQEKLIKALQNKLKEANKLLIKLIETQTQTPL